MNIADILTIYDYNYWANQKILTASQGVSKEQFLAPGDFPYGGLRGTLVHTLDAEQSWLSFLKNHDWSAPDLQAEDFPSVASVAGRWATEEKGMRAYLATLSDADLEAHLHYTIPSGVKRDRILWHALLHVVNHGTQHRSEAAALLTGFQHSPGDVDFTVFLNETGRS
jgi:uncharacterized damage-inducible protein DinB